MAFRNAHTHRLQGYLAAASRDHGPESPEAHAARRNFNTARIVLAIEQSIAEAGPFSDDHRDLIVTAVLGGDAR